MILLGPPPTAEGMDHLLREPIPGSFNHRKVKSLSCVQLFATPVDCSPPGSSIHGSLQARILEGVAIPFSKGSSWPRNQTQVSCIVGRFFTFWATREDPSVEQFNVFLSFFYNKTEPKFEELTAEMSERLWTLVLLFCWCDYIYYCQSDFQYESFM